MKKIIVILLAFCLLLSLAACAGGETKETDPPHPMRSKPPYPTPAQRRMSRARQS